MEGVDLGGTWAMAPQMVISIQQTNVLRTFPHEKDYKINQMAPQNPALDPALSICISMYKGRFLVDSMISSSSKSMHLLNTLISPVGQGLNR